MMHIRQPLAVLGFSFAAGLLGCAYFTTPQMQYAAILSIGLVLLGILLLLYRKGALLLVSSLMILLACVISLNQRTQLLESTEKLGGQAVSIAGTVSEGDADSGWLLSKAKVSTKAQTVTANILLQGDGDLTLSPGETITIEANLYDTPPHASQIGRGAQLTGWANSSTLRQLSPPPFWSQWRDTLLSYIQRNLRRTMGLGDNADLMHAILTGNDTAIPSRLYGDFQRAGIGHLLCVSGLHLSMMASIALFLLRPAGRRPALILSLVFMLLLVWLTGAGTSSLRALFMTTAAMSGELLHRETPPLNTLGGAVLLLTLWSPEVICQTGFLLSVSCILGLTVLLPAWIEVLDSKSALEEHRFLRAIVQATLPSLAITLATLPVMALVKGYTSLVSPIINIVMLPLVPFLLSCGLIAAFLGFAPAGFLCNQILDWITYLAEWGADQPVLPLGSSWAISCLITGIGVTFLLLALRGHPQIQTGISLLLLFCVSITGTMHFSQQQKALTISQLYGKEGSTLVLQLSNHAVVIGCGGSDYEGRQLADYLLASGVTRLEAIIIPWERLACTGGCYSLLTSFPAEMVISPEDSRVANAILFGGQPEWIPLTFSEWSMFDLGTLTIRMGKESSTLLLDLETIRICFQTLEDPIPYPADLHFFYNKKRPDSETTGQNYAIMKAALKDGTINSWRLPLSPIKEEKDSLDASTF